MKRVILTGASGFIGRHCIPFLIDFGYEVHAITSQTERTVNKGIRWHSVDILNPDHVSDMMDSIRPTHLLHLAWYTEPKKYWDSDENNKWLQASQQLIRKFMAVGGERVVSAGTCAEYDWNYGFCDEYSTPLKPATLYGFSKHALHMKIEETLRYSETSSAWGRIFFLYGPFEHPSRLVASIIIALIRGLPAPCTTGDQVRDYLFVEDVAEAFVRLLESSVKGTVNISSQHPVRIREIVGMIGEKTGRKDLIQYGEFPSVSGEAPVIVGRNRRIVEEVGWKQRYDLNKGLDRTISWWRERLSGENNDY